MVSGEIAPRPIRDFKNKFQLQKDNKKSLCNLANENIFAFIKLLFKYINDYNLKK